MPNQKGGIGYLLRIAAGKHPQHRPITPAVRCVLERRRGRNFSGWEEGSLDAEDARRLFNRVDELHNIEPANECWHHSELLTELFGEEWHYPPGDRAKEENHKFTYLRRVVEAVQEALHQEKRQVVA